MTQAASSLDTIAVPAPVAPEIEVADLLMRGYGLQGKLSPLVSELLFELIRMRLATTITILHWRQSARSEEDAYLKKALGEQSSEHFLQHLNRISRQGFADRVLTSIKTI